MLCVCIAEINITDANSDTMIFFWSGCGTERYIPHLHLTPTAAARTTQENDSVQLEGLRREVECLREDIARRENLQEISNFRILSLEERLKEHQA